MARKGKQAEAETVVVTHHVKEWQPTHDTPLPKIHATIDSWGHEGSAHSGATVSARTLDHEYVEAQVDKITKRVKGTQKVTITETVTEWVEGPMGSGPVAVEEDKVPQDAAGEGWSAKDAEKGKAGKDAKPQAKEGRDGKESKGLFGFFGRKRGKDADGAGKADKDYQPQCMALTDDGAQCRNSARGDSKYCVSHKGYQPPTAKGLAQRIEGDAWDPDDDVTDHESVRAQDTLPKVAKAKDTKLRTRKPARKGGKKKR